MGSGSGAAKGAGIKFKELLILLGMKERAELIGGTFELESQIDQGTRIAVCVNGGEAPS